MSLSSEVAVPSWDITKTFGIIKKFLTTRDDSDTFVGSYNKGQLTLSALILVLMMYIADLALGRWDSFEGVISSAKKSGFVVGFVTLA